MLHPNSPSPSHAPFHVTQVEVMAPHFTKYHLSNGQVIHHFSQPDHGYPHNHPWPFDSYILFGGYEEVEYTLTRVGYALARHTRLPGWGHPVTAGTIHRITALPMGECWTLVTPGKAVQKSGFYRFGEDGRVAHRYWDEPDEKLKPVFSFGVQSKTKADSEALLRKFADPIQVSELQQVLDELPKQDGSEGATCKAPTHAEYEERSMAKNGMAIGPETWGRMDDNQRIKLWEAIDQVAQRPAPDGSFVIGPNNTWAQAWEAMLAGHLVRLPKWGTDGGWIFDNEIQSIVAVNGDTPQKWLMSGEIMTATGKHLLATDWIVLPKVHPEPPVI